MKQQHSEAKAAARAAHLRYVDPDDPGIIRRRHGRGFSYARSNGRAVGRADRERISRLAIPPAWTSVWICPSAHGHIQAVGRDARGRKQYRYHDEWRRIRDQNKYDHLVDFAAALPRIRAHVERDLSRRALSKERVLAAVVRLLDLTHARIGNEEYARDNDSFGLTTARNRHARVSASKLLLSYRGKGGAACLIELTDRRLARVVARCQELPGQRLFEWLDAEGTVHPVDSSDVNDYLQQATGTDVTAKDFRTWAATLSVVCALERCGQKVRRPQREHALVEAVRVSARLLGNTPAVCRRSYLHPEPLEQYLGGTLGDSLAWCRAHPATGRSLSADEKMLRRLLQNLSRTARRQ